VGRPAGPGDAVRTFVAVPLEQELCRRLGQVVAGLQARLEGWLGPVRWVAPEQYHITLRFLGELSQRQVQEVAAALQRACGEEGPFWMSLTGLGVFPERGPVRVLWAGVDPQSGWRLSRLAGRLEQELQQAGFPPADAPFVPHLTRGRVKAPRARLAGGLAQYLAEVQLGQLGRCPVQAAVVMGSELRPSGPRYWELHRCPLGAGDSGTGHPGAGPGKESDSP